MSLIHCTQRSIMGGDPEFFLTRNGQIIPSQELIPEAGLPPMLKEQWDRVPDVGSHGGKSFYNQVNREAKKWVPYFVRDGIQVEMHIQQGTCRGAMIDRIKPYWQQLKSWLPPDIEVSFAQVIDLTPEQLQAMPKECQRLGCSPSLNLYDPTLTIGVDPETYLTRSAGGHIHLSNFVAGMDHHRTIAAMDLLVGVMSVLLDRDPLNAKRREVYGRAGEFRLPSHGGIEYRTLSNFWIRSGPLTALIMGLTRLVYDLMAGGQTYNMSTGRYTRAAYEAEQALFDGVDQDNVVYAINQNDFDRAWDIYQTHLKPWMSKYLPVEGYTTGASHPLHKGTLPEFEYVVEKGIDAFWPGRGMDVLDRLVNMGPGHGAGWEAFLRDTAGPLMRQEQRAKVTYTSSVA